MEVSREQRMIDDIMDNFEFSKVLVTRRLLDWKLYHDGGYGVPDHESELRRMARKNLQDCIDLCNENPKDSSFVGSGPFKATGYHDGEKLCHLELQFVVCGWEVYDDELDY
jgi:hypothetical protein